jgi:hypothetical protein
MNRLSLIGGRVGVGGNGQPLLSQQHNPSPLGHPGPLGLRPRPPLQLRPLIVLDRHNSHPIRHALLSRTPIENKGRHASDH